MIGAYRVLLSGMALTVLPAVLFAQSSAYASNGSQFSEHRKFETQEIEISEVIVTGSRLRQSEEGVAPVTVFNREKIDELGASNVGDVLAYLPQQSFAVHEGQSSTGQRIVRLRGLGIGTTLVLINGRRTVTSALTGTANVFDLNTIPLSAVDRIEVLSDSASAVYGADAIGGVVNVILKSQISEPVVDVYYGAADGGAAEKRGSLAFGGSNSRLRTSVVLDGYHRSTLLGGSRDRLRNQDYRSLGGIDKRSTFLTNPGSIESISGSNLPGLSSFFAAVPVGSTGLNLTTADFAATAGQKNFESIGRYASVLPETERLSGTVFAEWDVTQSVTAFMDAMYSHREDISDLIPPFLIFNVVPASNPFNPFQEDVFANFLFTGMDPLQSIAKAESFRGVAGLKGPFRTWNWEASLMRIHESGSSWTANDLDLQRVNAALSATDPSLAINPFQDGPGGSRALLESLVQQNPLKDQFTSQAFQGSAFAHGPIYLLPAGTVEMVLGGEMRDERLNIGLNSARILISPDRQTSALYSEIRVPIAGQQFTAPLIDHLAITLAGRYDQYSDFGETFNPQYGVQWSPALAFTVRASYGTSFRPPSLFELYQPRTESPTFISDPLRNNVLTAITRRSGGNSKLEPEEARSRTVGIVFRPNGKSDLRLGVSYWSIKQDQRVQSINLALMAANPQLFPGRIVREAPSPADVAAGLPGRLVSIDGTSVNFGRDKTNGIDVEVLNTFETSLGRFGASLLATWTKQFSAASLPNAAPVERVGIANNLGTIPRWKATASLTWNSRSVGVASNVRYVSSYDDVNDANVPTGSRVGDQALLDLQVSTNFEEFMSEKSTWLRGMALRVGMLNVFDEEPEFSQVGSGSASGFDPSQGDLRQRFTYLSLSKSF